MPLIPFPNVPNLPGVPQLSRTITPAIGGVVGAAAANLIPKIAGGILGGAILRALGSGAKWGIYDAEGNALADPASITGFAGGLLDSFGIGPMQSTVSVDYSRETRIADFPVEGGLIASYNKVLAPCVANVTLAVSGDQSARARFLTAIDIATITRDLYDVITPEKTFIGYAIEKYDYQRRAENGIGCIAVNLTLRQVRQVAAQYASVISSPADPGATPAKDGGAVQPAAPAQSVLKSAVNKIGSFLK